MKNITVFLLSIGLVSFSCSKKTANYPQNSTDRMLDYSKKFIQSEGIFTIDSDKKNYQLIFHEASLRDTLQDFSYRTVNTFNKNNTTYDFIKGKSKVTQKIYLTFYNNGKVEYYAPFFEKNLAFPKDSSSINSKYLMTGLIVKTPYEYENRKIVVNKDVLIKEKSDTIFTLFLENSISTKYIKRLDNKRKKVATTKNIDKIAKIESQIVKIERKPRKSIYLTMEIDSLSSNGMFIKDTYIQKQIESNSYSHIQVNPTRAFNLGTLSQRDNRPSKLYFNPKKIE